MHMPLVSGDWSVYLSLSPKESDNPWRVEVSSGWEKGGVCSQGTGKCKPLQPDASPGLTSESTRASFMHGAFGHRCGVRASFWGDENVKLTVTMLAIY